MTLINCFHGDEGKNKALSHRYHSMGSKSLKFPSIHMYMFAVQHQHLTAGAQLPRRKMSDVKWGSNVVHTNKIN